MAYPDYKKMELLAQFFLTRYHADIKLDFEKMVEPIEYARHDFMLKIYEKDILTRVYLISPESTMLSEQSQPFSVTLMPYFSKFATRPRTKNFWMGFVLVNDEFKIKDAQRFQLPEDLVWD